MLFAAEGHLDHHPVPQSRDPAQRAVSRLEAYVGRRPGASAWIARPDQSAHFMVSDRKMTSGHHFFDAGRFVHAWSESREWVIRSLSSRKVGATRNASVVRDPNTRNSHLALSGDLIGRHGSLNTSPGAYRASVRAHFASHLLLSLRRSSWTARSLACPSPSCRL